MEGWEKAKYTFATKSVQLSCGKAFCEGHGREHAALAAFPPSDVRRFVSLPFIQQSFALGFMQTGQLIIQPYHSPCGTLLLGVHETGFCLCDWVINPRHEQVIRRLCKGLGAETIQGDAPLLQRARRQLDEYFQGHRQVFDLPLRWVGTEFQQAVWQVLQTIPYGQTRSYMEQAECLGRSQAVRAVANANALNAMAIIVPCHRVVGSNGRLTGFAGGLNAKRFLLELEGCL